jgi:hypothetical protein
MALGDVHSEEWMFVPEIFLIMLAIAYQSLNLKAIVSFVTVAGYIRYINCL